jgi:hypothetical protein
VGREGLALPFNHKRLKEIESEIDKATGEE